MIINLTFDCECGGSVDENIYVSDPEPIFEAEAHRLDHYEQLACDSCSQVYEAHIIDKHGNVDVQVDGAFNLGWERIDPQRITEPAMQFDDWDDELTWVMRSTVQLENFQKIMTDVVQLLNAGITLPNMSTLYNMAFAQVVTAVEAYLSGIFIHTVVSSQMLMRKLIETDPELGNRPLALRNIFTEWEGLQLVVATYLHDLLFHKLDKVKPMYLSVLNIDFGEVGWLFRAVKLRHDCVHRNGVDKSGKPTGIGYPEIESLIRRCAVLIVKIDQEVGRMADKLEEERLLDA